MSDVSTTKMSSKGQVVIPEDIRTKLGLAPGVQFAVVGDRDVVMLKVINPPSIEKLGGLLREARKQAKKAGMKSADISRAIKKTRKKS